MRNKFIFALMLIMIISILYFVYRPVKINEEYGGIYFDNDNSELSKKVNINISGIIKRDLMLKPESFVGSISIDSSTFEFSYPIKFDKVIKTFRLTLDQYNKGVEWNFYDESNLFQHPGDDVFWSIYVNRDISKITFVPIIRGTSSTERVAAPCDNREEAMNITLMLNSGGQ